MKLLRFAVGSLATFAVAASMIVPSAPLAEAAEPPKLTLITNIGTAASPVGVTDSGWSGSTWGSQLGNDGSVVFYSSASGLPGHNGRCQVYRWTPATGVVLLSNVGTSASPIGANGDSVDPQISDNGSVVFSSTAGGLPGANGKSQVYLWSASVGLTLITNTRSGKIPAGANGWSGRPQIGSDGSVAFMSDATNLPGGNGKRQVYLWTTAAGLTLVSNSGTPTAPVGADDPNTQVLQVADDHSVLFTSKASNLPGGNNWHQIYLWMPATGVTLVSNAGTANAPVGANWDCYGGQVGNGHNVVFECGATNLPGSRVGGSMGSGGNAPQVYLWTPSVGLTLITNTGTAQSPKGTVGAPSESQINARGSILFQATGTDLPGAKSGRQAYLWTVKGGLRLVSDVDGLKPKGAGAGKCVAAIDLGDDDSVVFESYPCNPTPECWWNEALQSTICAGSLAARQIYIWTSAAGLTLVSNSGTVSTPIETTVDAFHPRVNHDGSVIFTSRDRYFPGGNGSDQLYLWTRASSSDGFGSGSDGTTPLFRFYNTQTGAHFYTADANEKDNVLAKYAHFNFEPSPGKVIAGTALKGANQVQVYRFYLPTRGTHFYTADPAERDHVIATWPDFFTYEGPAYVAFDTAVAGSVPLYRFYNVNTGVHFYTASADERDHVIATWPDVFTYEGPGYYIIPS